MKLTTPPLLLLLTMPAMAKLDSMSTGADYIHASVSEQENYAYVIAKRLNKTSVDMAVDGQDIDGCLRGMLIGFEEAQEAAHVRLTRTNLQELAVRCAVMVNSKK